MPPSVTVVIRKKTGSFRMPRSVWGPIQDKRWAKSKGKALMDVHPSRVWESTVPEFQGSCWQVRRCDCQKGPSSLPESTSNGNDDSDQPRHLHGSPEARHPSSTIILRGRTSSPAPPGKFLTRVKERARLWSLIMVRMGMRLSSGVGMLGR